MGTDRDLKAERFRYLPGFLPLIIGLGLFGFVVGLIGIPYFGARDGWLMSPKGVFLFLLAIAGNLFVWLVISKIWQLHWRFTLTTTHLIAGHRLRGQRIEIPWESIVSVRKLPRAWWARGGGGLAVSQIETASGQQIPFMTHLMLGYDRFLKEIRSRAVNCRVFDPYFDEWE
jgi:hypothetical protein